MSRMFLAGVCLLFAGPALEGERNRQTFFQVADRMAKAINAADAQAVRKDFGPVMLKEFPVEKCQEFMKAVAGDFGKINKLDPPTFVSADRANFVAHCQRGLMDFTLNLDDQGRVAGILFAIHLPVAPKNTTRLALPFKGSWLVVWGGDTAELNHHHANRSQRFAFDFLGVGPDGKTHKGDGHRNEDYYAFGRQILAPADGVVTDVIEGVRDNTPETMNPLSALGNAVFIQHGQHEVSVLAHLQQGSTKVKVGDKVKKGQVLGLCGNSGNSSQPHLHYHLQNTPIIPDATGIKCYFEAVVVGRDASKSKPRRYSPIKDDVIKSGN